MTNLIDFFDFLGRKGTRAIIKRTKSESHNKFEHHHSSTVVEWSVQNWWHEQHRWWFLFENVLKKIFVFYRSRNWCSVGGATQTEANGIGEGKWAEGTRIATNSRLNLHICSDIRTTIDSLPDFQKICIFFDYNFPRYKVRYINLVSFDSSWYTLEWY